MARQIKIALYNENTLKAGQIVIGPYNESSGDIFTWIGDRQELEELARSYAVIKAVDFHTKYQRNLGVNVLAYLHGMA